MFSFLDELTKTIAQKVHMYFNQASNDFTHAHNAQATYSFLKLWKKLNKRIAESGTKTFTPDTYIEIQERLIHDFTDQFDALHSICAYQFIDIVNLIIATMLNAPSDGSYNRRVVNHLEERFGKGIFSVLQRYSKVTSGFLGIAQNVDSAAVYENGKLKMLRKLSLLVIRCCHVQTHWNCKKLAYELWCLS